MNDEKQALVPKLRFPEYVGQRLRKALLKEVTAESGERVGDNFSTMQVMGVSKMEGIVPMEGRLISSDISRYKIVRKNWFAYNPMRLNIGSIARWKGEQNILVSPDYVVFKCLNGADLQIDPEYLNHFRQSDVWKQFVTEGGDGSVRVRIYYRDLARLQLLLPGRDEQQKIADCLSSLDALIAAQADKLDALKTHKKGLMQQLFPREGETVPRLRFPEFLEAGEWKNKSIQDLIDSRFITGHLDGNHGSLYPRAEEFSVDGIPYITANDFIDGTVNFGRCKHLPFERAKKFNKGVSKDGDVLFAHNATVGPVAKLNTSLSFVILSTTATYFRCDNSKLLNDFLLFALGSPCFIKQYSRVMSQSTRNQVPITAQRKFDLQMPPVFDEQQKIASCLSSLDALIAAQTDKLDALKTHKKGLMQQLFPSPEAVGA